ncbi:MAG: methionyl-tRNA formyltransferase [Arcobacteraceae bacterium]
MSKRIVFMGTPSYATTILEKLLEKNFDVVALFTQQDKKVGRKQELTPPHIKQYCLDNHLSLPIFQPEKLRDNQAMVDELQALKADFIVVAAYGQILPKAILEIAPCINLHASLLPKYRGASPIQEALLHDDTYTGVTAMLMEEGLDTGDILGFKYLKIEPTLEVEEAFDKLSQEAAVLTIEVLHHFDSLHPLKQNNMLSSLCKKIKKEHGEVTFLSAKALVLKYKAYSFWPGVFLQSGLKLKKISLLDETSCNQAGQILEIDKEGVVVGCQKGKVKIKIFQAPSKNELSALDYLRGQRLGILDFIN